MKQAMLKLLREFGSEQDASGTVLFAAGLTALVGSAALAVDAGQIYAIRAELEKTADAAALAAATGLPRPLVVKSIATEYAAKNMPVEKYGVTVQANDVQIGHWDAASREFSQALIGATAVHVTARYTMDDDSSLRMYFAPLFGVEDFSIEADAVAGSHGVPCIMTLDPDNKESFHMEKGSEVMAIGCGIQVNSRDDKAMHLKTKSVLVSDGACVSGGVRVDGSARAAPYPNEFCPAIVDPLAHLQPPHSNQCDFKDRNVDGGVVVLRPGTYCGGLKIDKSSVIFEPGTYVIRDGKFEVKDNSKIVGADVTFYLEGENSTLKIERKASVNLMAPVQGLLAGILIFRDREFGGKHEFNSENVDQLIGTIYIPEGNLHLEGTGQITPVGSCNVLIVDDLFFGSDSVVSIDITGANCQDRLPMPLRKNIALLD